MNEQSSLWAQFVAKQAEIYGNFAKGAIMASEQGTKPDPALAENKGAYMLVLRPANQVLELAEAFAYEFAEVVPEAYPYRIDQLHTTVFDYRLAGGFQPDAQPDHEQVLDTLCRVATHVQGYTLRQKDRAGASYEGYAFNQTTSILKGFPNEKFFRLAISAVQVAKSEDLDVKMPWGGHVTTNRFKSAVSGNRIPALFDVVLRHNTRIKALGTDAFPYQSIDVCWFTASLEQGFHPRVVESFKL